MKRTKLKNPSLPYIISTGLMLIGLEVHWAWELSTPRERAAIVVAMAGEQRVIMGAMMTLSSTIGIGGEQNGEMK
jgi:hypothetical protein